MFYQAKDLCLCDFTRWNTNCLYWSARPMEHFLYSGFINRFRENRLCRIGLKELFQSGRYTLVIYWQRTCVSNRNRWLYDSDYPFEFYYHETESNWRIQTLYFVLRWLCRSWKTPIFWNFIRWNANWQSVPNWCRNFWNARDRHTYSKTMIGFVKTQLTKHTATVFQVKAIAVFMPVRGCYN